ncbi:MAG: hypothetical protein JXR70_01005 [Spirochaetales bacterium]|nr:hypothetical protein [Spirochaetales bacterium]
MLKKLEIPSKGKSFNNHVKTCVGTGKMSLAMRKEYLEHLEIVQKSIGFQYIRGHGLFCDDVGIYREFDWNGKIHSTYNFTYLDKIFDSYLSLGIRPFIELGFMPEKLKSGDQSVFWWKGNVTPPKSYEKWAELVKKTLEHLIQRYGREEVITWPIEVWNEPNIGFWAGSMEDYFKLYDYSAKAIKEVDKALKVGGPSICGVETEKWLRGFFEHCINSKSPLDFITRHCYTAEPPDYQGHYIYHSIKNPAVMIEELQETRAIMKAYPEISNLPLHITEFNSSYVPLCPIHDSLSHGPFIARILSEAGDYADSYSYWTFSDVFEEMNIPLAPFHGGFGMLAFEGIKKPTFYAFEFFSKAGKELLYRDENMVVTKNPGKYIIIAWNYQDQNLDSDKEAEIRNYSLALPSLGFDAWVVKQEIGRNYGNPVQTWSNMGKPRSLTSEQVEILKASSRPRQNDFKLIDEDGQYHLQLSLESNHLCMVEILPLCDETESYLGFDVKRFYGLDS